MSLAEKIAYLRKRNSLSQEETFGAAGRFAAGSVQVGGGGIRARHRKPCADFSSVRCFGGFYGEGRLRNVGN